MWKDVHCQRVIVKILTQHVKCNMPDRDDGEVVKGTNQVELFLLAFSITNPQRQGNLMMRSLRYIVPSKKKSIVEDKKPSADNSTSREA